MTFGTWWDHIILYLIEGILSSFGVFRQKYMMVLGYFQAIFQKVSENGYLPLTKHLETYLKLLKSLYHALIVHKNWKKKSFEKNLLRLGFYVKHLEGKANIPPAYPHPHPSPGIRLKRHTLNIEHYLHKSYLHKKFVLAYIRISKLLKKTISRSLLKNLVL